MPAWAEGRVRATMWNSIGIHNLTVRRGGNLIIDDLSLELRGRAVCLFGPSGCGKTTLLNTLAGLIQPEAGSITGMPERVAYLFQEDRLLPWVSALENVQAVAKGSAGAVPELSAEEWLLKMGLQRADLSKLPGQLSGGMKRRVALARALAFGGDIMLMDEPFRGQDDKRRQELMDILRQHTADMRLVMVTHDIAEAEQLCDDIVQMPLAVIG